MPRQPARIQLTAEEEATLTAWTRKATMERRFVERAQIILLLHQGSTTVQIAARLHTRTARVSKWRQRFAQDRLPGLTDAPRSGKPVQYGAKVKKRILALLDQPPREGYAGWNGTLLAAALQDVSKHQVWRVLRRHKIYLQRRRSWCISTDPEFASKAADIVGLYLSPPENALLLCVD